MDQEAHDEAVPLRGHVIIIGYGLNGENVARVLASTGIAHIVLDEDADRVAKARAAGSRAIVADAGDHEALRHAAVDQAIAAIIAISDPYATRRIAKLNSVAK
jgi:CPA2 family monovalent cation:H+ antiporter-2